MPIGVSKISIAGYHLFTNFDADLSDLGKNGCREIAIYVAECLHPFWVSYPSDLNEHFGLTNLWTIMKTYLLVTSTTAHNQISLLVLMICAALLFSC